MSITSPGTGFRSPQLSATVRRGQALAALLIAAAALAPAQEAQPPRSAGDRAIEILGNESIPAADRIARLAALVEEDPTDAAAFVAYGEALEAAGEDGRALAQFERAAYIDAGLATAWEWIGLLSKRQARDLTRAETAFRKALELGAPPARTHNELGVTLAMGGRMAEALDSFEAATAADPQWGAAYNNAIKAATSIGDRKRARELFLRAIEAERFEENALLLWCGWLVEQDRREEAVADYRLALERHPDNPRLRYQLGATLSEMGRKQRDEARTELEAAREHARGQGDGRTARAAARTLFAVDHKEDDERFRRAVRLVFEPQESQERAAKSAAKAQELLDPIVEKHPGFQNAVFIRGVARLAQGDAGGAGADFSRAVELEPDEPNALIELAGILRGDGRAAEAMPLATRAVENAGRDPGIVMKAVFVALDAEECFAAKGWVERLEALVGPEAAAPARDEFQLRCGD
ncbi:MAG: tetratricopeptide repeat protein [Candidatus Sumerlaeia bacterium]|nr:tetratricopeptide repeat protein [Candidatus Sumerlaeia bacterium]